VATDAGSTADLFQGDNMLLVRAGDPEALREGMRQVIEDTALRQRLRSRARESALASCTTEVMVERILAIYERVLARGRAGGGSARSRS